MPQSRKRVRVLIVDDSATVRQTLADILAADPDIEVLGIASDPFVAAARIRDEVPDVITLDAEMPRMDGITFLRKLMAQHPIPVVMCSSLVEAGSETLLQALEAGAVDIILKPRMGVSDHLTEARMHICEVVKGAAQARVGRGRTAAQDSGRKLTADAMLPAGTLRRHGTHHRDGYLHRCLHRRHGVVARGAGRTAERFTGDRHRSAHA